MVLMATLTHRSTDCLGGSLHRDAFRRYPSRGVCAAATADNKRTRPGGHRGRKPRHAAATTVQPQKRAMENVVILKRGEQVVRCQSETTVTPAVASPVAQAENAECGEPSVKVDSAVADDRGPAPTDKAGNASSTKIETETLTSADRCSVQASMPKAVAAADRRAEPVKKAEAVAAANRIGTKAMKAEAVPTVYSGASFLVSPDPWELPIPVALLKPRGERTGVCA